MLRQLPGIAAAVALAAAFQDNEYNRLPSAGEWARMQEGLRRANSPRQPPKPKVDKRAEVKKRRKQKHR